MVLHLDRRQTFDRKPIRMYKYSLLENSFGLAWPFFGTNNATIAWGVAWSAPDPAEGIDRQQKDI